MKRRYALLWIPTLAAGMLFWLRDGSARHVALRSPAPNLASNQNAIQGKAAAADFSRAPVGRAVALSTQVSASPRASHDAKQLERMYDEMSELLEASPDDCEALAYGMATLIEATPREAVAAQLPLGSAAEEELRAVLTRKVERLRSAFQQALPACSAQLAPELAKLRSAERPPSEP